MAKQEKIQIRMTKDLKERYMRALAEQEFAESATDHLTRHIIDFVRKHEAEKAKKEKASLAR